MFTLRVPRLLVSASSITASQIHTSSLLCGAWYSRLQRVKKPKIPRKNAPVFNFDWEHKRFKPSDQNSVVEGIEKLPEFQALNEEQKKAFTYGHIPLPDDYRMQLTKFMAKYNLHPANDSLLARVLSMSFKIQYNKFLLEKQAKAMNLRAATESLVQRRMRLLRRLRALNKDDFKIAMEALGIERVKFLDPFDFGPPDEVVLRKQKVKNECYQQRLAKLARYKKELAASQEEFYARKERELKEMVEKFEGLGMSKEEAQAKIRDLFQVVVKERQEEALAPIRMDKLEWYAKERVLRRHVLECLQEKEAQQLRSRRK